MKSKEQILRSDFKNNILNNVTFRFEYTGIIDILDFIKGESKYLNNFFSEQDDFNPSSLDIQNIDYSSLSERISISISELLKNRIYRYTSTKIFNSDVTLDICKHYINLDIKCINYEGLDKYLEFFIDLITKLIRYYEFISPQNIALKKLSENYFDHLENAFNTLEEKEFNLYLKKEINNYDDYLDALYRDQVMYDQNTILISTKKVQKGTVVENNEEKETFRLSLEFEVIFGEEHFKTNNLTEELLDKIKKINELLFDLFKNNVKVEFLNSLIKGD